MCKSVQVGRQTVESTLVVSLSYFTLKELKEKKYIFPYSNVPNMLEDLLQKKVIELFECKHQEEMGCVDDPNYCHYHWIVSHSVKKCFILKELIMKLAR